MTPKYTHDCKNCRYLGPHTSNWNHPEGHRFDLYVCEPKQSTALGPSFIARYGDEGPEYLSTAESVFRPNSGRIRLDSPNYPLLEVMDRFDKERAKADATDWTAPWMRRCPERPTNAEDAMTFLLHHGEHDGAFACNVKLYKLGLSRDDDEKVGAMFAVDADLPDTANVREMMESWDALQNNYDHAWIGRSGGWIALHDKHVSHRRTTYPSLERVDIKDDAEVLKLAHAVWDFDKAVESAIRAGLAWVRKRKVLNSDYTHPPRIVYANPDACDMCNGKGWLLLNKTVMACPECQRFATNIEAIDAAFAEYAKQFPKGHTGEVGHRPSEVVGLVVAAVVREGSTLSAFMTSVAAEIQERLGEYFDETHNEKG